MMVEIPYEYKEKTNGYEDKNVADSLLLCQFNKIIGLGYFLMPMTLLPTRFLAQLIVPGLTLILCVGYKYDKKYAYFHTAHSVVIYCQASHYFM